MGVGAEQGRVGAGAEVEGRRSGTDLELQVVGDKVGEVAMAAHRAFELQGA